MNRAIGHGWTRDLLGQVRAEVNERLYMHRQHEDEEQDHVAIAASAMVQVIQDHRCDIALLRHVYTQALSTMSTILSIDLRDGPDFDQNMHALKVLQVKGIIGKSQGLVNALDTMASAYQRIVAMERQAYGLDSSISSPSSDIEPGDAPRVATVQVYLPDNHRQPKVA